MERTAVTRASMKRKKGEVLVCQEKKLFRAMFVFKYSLSKVLPSGQFCQPPAARHTAGWLPSHLDSPASDS
ncbi:hypothetical protein V8C44DRAFT_319147 [Trichoderma aethiopicum]